MGTSGVSEANGVYRRTTYRPEIRWLNADRRCSPELAIGCHRAFHIEVDVAEENRPLPGSLRIPPGEATRIQDPAHEIYRALPCRNKVHVMNCERSDDDAPRHVIVLRIESPERNKSDSKNERVQEEEESLLMVVHCRGYPVRRGIRTTAPLMNPLERLIGHRLSHAVRVDVPAVKEHDHEGGENDVVGDGFENLREGGGPEGGAWGGVSMTSIVLNPNQPHELEVRR